MRAHFISTFSKQVSGNTVLMFKKPINNTRLACDIQEVMSYEL